MLKKLLSLIVLITVIGDASVFAQCTPGTGTIPGITPDSATGLPPAYVGYQYNCVVQARIPADTIVFGQFAVVDSFKIDNITGLPPAFTYACNPGTCVFPGGSNGCILISGMPSATGTFNLIVNLIAYGTIPGIGPVQLPFTVNYYKIVIHPFSAAGIPQNSNYTFVVSQNEPNPFGVYSNINFTSPSGGKAELKIYNLIGKEIYKGSYRVNTGKNTIRIDAKEFESGVYMYTLSMGDLIVTKRMIISKK